MTGTSVSTLVVSAAAAVRWARAPHLSSFDVMEEIWKTGSRVDPLIDFCLDPKNNCARGTTARRVWVDPETSVQQQTLSEQSSARWPRSDGNLPLRSELIAKNLAGSDLVKFVEFTTLQKIDHCDPEILAVEERTSRFAYLDFLFGRAPNLCPQRWAFDVAAQPWLGPQPGSDHNPDCRYTGNSPGTLVLEFKPCFRIGGRPARIDDLTLVAGDVAYRLPLEGFTLGDPALACPSDPGQDDPRRVQYVLKGFSFEGLHPMYLAVTVNEKQAVITPILEVLK